MLIPDANATGVTIPITVSGVGTLSDLNFRFDGTASSTDPASTTVGVNHSWIGDLIFRLKSPQSGITVTFYNQPAPAGSDACSANNIWQFTLDDQDGSAIGCPGTTNTGPLTGTAIPDSPFSVWNGENPMPPNPNAIANADTMPLHNDSVEPGLRKRARGLDSG